MKTGYCPTCRQQCLIEEEPEEVIAYRDGKPVGFLKRIIYKPLKEK